ncbi:MAG: DUF2254 domain-containing protein [Andreesenia angusta]|nr:DUF2254 domain-containing protein [Andreesenia angusta]
MVQKLKLKYEKNKIWIYPLKYILVACFLSIITIAIDTRYISLHDYIPEVFLTSVDLAQTILGALVGSLLSITTFTFSTTMVVLTMYSSDFSPRVVENFLSEKITMKVLGMFMGGFFYSITALLFMRKTYEFESVISATIGVIYAILSLVYFAIFINKVSESIQANNLITKLHNEAEDTIDAAREYHSQSKLLEYFELGENVFKKNIRSDKNGYLELVSYQDIYDDIKSGDYTLIIHPNNGDFVVRNEIIASLYSRNNEIDEDILKKMNSHFTLQSDRSIKYDYLFALEKIIDVALRAISPGINDPNTAIECINILGILLSQLSEIDGNFSEMKEDDSNSRIIYPYFNFDHDLYETFYQIIIYGKEDLSVVLSIYKALENIMINATIKNQQHVRRFAKYLEDKTNEFYTNEIDRELLNKAKEKIINIHEKNIELN